MKLQSITVQYHCNNHDPISKGSITYTIIKHFFPIYFQIASTCTIHVQGEKQVVSILVKHKASNSTCNILNDHDRYSQLRGVHVTSKVLNNCNDLYDRKNIGTTCILHLCSSVLYTEDSNLQTIPIMHHSNKKRLSHSFSFIFYFLWQTRCNFSFISTSRSFNLWY